MAKPSGNITLFSLKRLIVCICALLAMPVLSADTIIIEHYQKHERYQYGVQLLDLAMSKLGVEYDIRAPDSQNMNEARGELSVISGHLDIQWMSTTAGREENMIPIKIPIYRWILGARLLLVQKERQAEMSQIRTLEDLRKYKAVHGKHWGDLPVYAANGLPVTSLVKYESLFKLLPLGRADYFHRGVNEIWGEAERYKNDLAVADNVMLFYPHPVYYFVTPGRVELAKKIEEGLRLAEEDGSFKHHFLNYHRDFIERAKLDSRTMIVLNNPVLPRNSPDIDASWWLPEKFDRNIRQTYGRD